MAPYSFQTDSQGRIPEYLGAYEDRHGNIWAFGDTYLINLAEGKRFNYFRSSDPASLRIWSLCEGHDGQLWIGTSGRGLFCFEDNRFQPVIPSENRWPYDVRAICEDREGNLWLGTSGGGLAQHRPHAVHILPVEEGLPDSMTTALALDTDGSLYVGLQRGGLWRREPGKFDPVNFGEGFELQSFITSVCVARDGTVWAGTLGEGLCGFRKLHTIRFTTADGLNDNTILAVCVDAEGGVWASTSAGGVCCFNGNKIVRYGAAQGLPGSPVIAMSLASVGGFWLGTRDGNILREQNGKFSTVEIANNGGYHPVISLYEGDQHRLWIGTDGGGLSCFANGVTMNWNTNSGLPSETVAGILEDGARNLWLETGAGIYRVDRSDSGRTLNSRGSSLFCKLIYGAKTVSQSGTIFGGKRAVFSPEGFISFATSDGLLNVDTHQTEIEPPALPVCLVSAAINGEPPINLLNSVLWRPSVSTNIPFITPVDLRSLEIRFTALSFKSPKEIQFRHKLEGFDSDWVEDADSRFARFGKLTRGDYRFMIAARLSGGLWQTGNAVFAFRVPTPIYFQTWALFTYVIFSVALVAITVRVISHRRLRNTLARLEQQRSLERERMRIARDMHDEIGSKLTKISFLSEHIQLDSERSQPFNDKIQSIAQTSRDLLKTMDEIVWVVNPRNDTLDNLTTYLSHYAVEYFQNTSIECELTLPAKIPHQPLSSEIRHNLFLTFEEALNNVLKHSGATNVKVTMNATSSSFELSIADNGKGFNIPAPNTQPRGGRSGNGLKNMRQRLSGIGGECFVSSRPKAGTCVTIRIRLKKVPANEQAMT